MRACLRVCMFVRVCVRAQARICNVPKRRAPCEDPEQPIPESLLSALNGSASLAIHRAPKSEEFDQPARKCKLF